MCGIFVAHYKNGPVQLDRCEQALELLGARGPDFSYSDHFPDSRVFLGQTVLSITGDPSEQLGRYHVSRSSRFSVAFNGEIYNHAELARQYLEPAGISNSSGTDTETLINLHDHVRPENVHLSLSGMFTYVIHDTQEQSILIGRDLIGEKILYRYEDNDILLLTSEISPILSIVPDLDLNLDALREYFFTRHFLAPERTAYKGITLVPSGSFSSFDVRTGSWNNIHRRQLSDLIDADRLHANESKDEKELFEEAEAVFSESGRLLAPPDVEYASTFSGGMDSSLASAYLKLQKEPRLFVGLGFPGKDDVASQISGFQKYLDSTILTVDVDTDDFKDKLIDSYEVVRGPLPTHSFVSQSILSEVVRSAGLKVIVGGDGGDELFGGYESYKNLLTDGIVPEISPSAYSSVVDIGFSFGEWSPEPLRAKLGDFWQRSLEAYEHELNPGDRVIQSVLYLDTTLQLESTGIRASDVMSMMHSVEPRCFFLTLPMMAFAVNLPVRYKLDPNSRDPLMITRPLIKKMFVNQYSQRLLFPKQGFSGHPNEAAGALIGTRFPLTVELLGMEGIPTFEGEIGRAAEWKMLNMELFLASDRKRRNSTLS